MYVISGKINGQPIEIPFNSVKLKKTLDKMVAENGNLAGKKLLLRGFGEEVDRIYKVRIL